MCAFPTAGMCTPKRLLPQAAPAADAQTLARLAAAEAAAQAAAARAAALREHTADLERQLRAAAAAPARPSAAAAPGRGGADQRLVRAGHAVTHQMAHARVHTGFVSALSAALGCLGV